MPKCAYVDQKQQGIRSCYRYITRVRGRCLLRKGHAGICPRCLRPTPQSPAYLLCCQWQQVVRGEWYLRPPCDPPWGCHNPALWPPNIQASNAGQCMLLHRGACIGGALLPEGLCNLLPCLVATFMSTRPSQQKARNTAPHA